MLIIPNSSRFFDLILCALITLILIVSTIIFIRCFRPALIYFLSGIIFLFLFNYFLFCDDLLILTVLLHQQKLHKELFLGFVELIFKEYGCVREK
jgi:hypothetical protein